MSKITASTDFDRLPKEEVPRYLSIWAEQVSRVINGDISFFSNIKIVFKVVTFIAANTTIEVETGLDVVATNYIVVNNSTNAIVYDGNRPNVVGILYVQASQATTATLMILY